MFLGCLLKLKLFFFQQLVFLTQLAFELLVAFSELELLEAGFL
jgi:hypothetical protein